MSAARCRPPDPVLEAADLLGRELWDSTRARLYESGTVCVLLSSQRASPAIEADVYVTVLATTGALGEKEPVTVTLTGPGGSHAGRLDARGRCTIRGVPDGRYRVDMRRMPARYAPVLLLPLD